MAEIPEDMLDELIDFLESIANKFDDDPKATVELLDMAARARAYAHDLWMTKSN